MKYSILFLYCCLLSILAFGQNSDFPPRPNPPRLVNDLADMLTPDEEKALEQKLVNYNDTTSTQIAIVTITSIGGYDINQYATQLGQQWGVGGKENNNGLIILVAKNERQVSIQTGYGMEHIIPDAIAKRITERTLKPSFRKGEYYKGLDDATNFIISVASGEYQADPSAASGEGEGGSSVFLIILIVMVIIFFISRRGGGGGGKGRYARTLGGPIIIPGGFGSFSSGGGVFGGGGGGGFGGFGGGSFGGGGASSSW